MSKRRSLADLAMLVGRNTSGWHLVRPALLVYLVIVVTGIALGALVYVAANDGCSWPTSVARTTIGWRVRSPDGLQQSSVALASSHMVWNNGGCIELLDLRSGKTSVLALPPSDESRYATLCISDRYVVWTVVKVPGDDGAFKVEVHAYDLARHHLFVVTNATGCDGTIALAGSVLYWESNDPQQSNGRDAKIRGLDLASGRSFVVASGRVQLESACGSLVMWSQSEGKRAGDWITVIKDLDSDRLRRLRPCADTCLELTGPGLLTGRVAVWRLESTSASSDRARIEAFDFDRGVRRVIAQGDVSGPSVGGGRVLWSDAKRRLFIEKAAGGPAVPLSASWDSANDFPVISDTTIAWETCGDNTGCSNTVETARLDR